MTVMPLAPRRSRTTPTARRSRRTRRRRECRHPAQQLRGCSRPLRDRRGWASTACTRRRGASSGTTALIIPASSTRGPTPLTPVKAATARGRGCDLARHTTEMTAGATPTRTSLKAKRADSAATARSAAATGRRHPRRGPAPARSPAWEVEHRLEHAHQRARTGLGERRRVGRRRARQVGTRRRTCSPSPVSTTARTIGGGREVPRPAPPWWPASARCASPGSRA